MRHAIALCAFLLLILHTNAQSFGKQFTEANILTEDGIYGLAIPIWEELIKEKDNANLNYKLGSCYLNLSIDKQRALPYLQKAAKDIRKIYDPFTSDFEGAPIETYYYLAKAYHINNELDSAELYYQRFLDEASKKQYLRPATIQGLIMCKVARELMANPIDVEIVNVGPPINSEFAEYTPIVAFDENTLYFTSRRLRLDSTNDGKTDARSGTYYEDMYACFKSRGGKWMAPELLNINSSDEHSSVVSMSPDGGRIYMYKTFSGNGNLYESEFVIGTGWTTPKLVGSNVNTDANEYYATITYDEQRLYFVSDRKGGLGGKDIYMSKKLPNGEWSEAKNVGAPINTQYDEDVPYFHPDDKTMYFASNGHKSMGGYDIFYSQQDSNGNWSESVNIGYPINTTDDDHSYICTPDGLRAYYSSKGKNSIGSMDIYMVQFKEKEDKALPKFDLSSFAVIRGWVFAAPGEPFPDDLTITVVDTKTGAQRGNAKPAMRNGSFVFIVPSGSDYEIDISLGETSVYNEQVSIPTGSEYKELSREVFLAPNGSKKAIVTLKDDVLGDVLKWRLSFKDPEKLVPLGSKVYYLDENENILDSAFVSKDGFFQFKEMKADGAFIIRPVIKDESNADLSVVLVEPEDESRPIELVFAEEVFYEKGHEPKLADASDPKKKSEEIKKEKVKKPTKNTTEGSVSKNTDEDTYVSVSENEYRVTFGFNISKAASDSDLKKMATAIKNKVDQDGNAEIKLIGSASQLPTSRKGGNKQLAQDRLTNGKTALMKELKNQGVDINKISTISEEAFISGPTPAEIRKQSKMSYTDFQYFMMILN